MICCVPIEINYECEHVLVKVIIDSWQYALDEDSCA